MLPPGRRQGKGRPKGNGSARHTVWPANDGAEAAEIDMELTDVALRAFFIVVALGAALIGFTLPTPGQADHEPAAASQVATLDLD